MKKLAFTCISALLILGVSCKETKKESAAEKTEVKAEMYHLVADSTAVSFTAYKTSEKLPVGGKFTTINIKDNKAGLTQLEALKGTTFSIPVSSLFTNDATGTRDPKIKEFFFGVMKNTELISGKFNVSDGNKTYIDVTLNGETKSIFLTSETNGNKMTFTGVMQLEEWNAIDAVTSLNKVCEVLHTGKDGVSKTWTEVAVKAEVLFEKK